ncbi:MAG: protein tyrosine phosphatase [Planctomycetes bacterium]|nr:protein tyrosine phosphatase [Planctomycetota bacterium]
MNQITPHLLWIGHAGEGRAFPELADKGIRALVQLAFEEPPLQLPRDFIYCRYPLVDAAGNDPELLKIAVNSVADLLRREVATLLFCGAGMSRAPAIAAAAIAVVDRASPDVCLKRVHECHATDVTPGLWEDLKSLLQG